ncbi:MAG TPA: hypothetical protein VJ953_08770 [Saprospiraceae bacterium]|nr:hypothetical protein [Saprospiraceae bacterium]
MSDKKNKHHLDFEQYVREQRQAFNRLEQVDETALWQQIQPAVQTGSAKGWMIELGTYWKWSIAASIAVLLVSVFYLGQRSAKHPVAKLADYAPTLKQEAESYQQRITQKETTLQVSQLNQAAYQDVFDELAILDSMHQEMLQELPAFSDQQRLIQNLKKYYERKLFLLEKLSREIEKQKKQDYEAEQSTLL